MSTIAFDSDKFVKDLRETGIPEHQAEAFVRAQQGSFVGDGGYFCGSQSVITMILKQWSPGAQ